MESASFATTVTSPTGEPLAIERTMTWDAAHGAHAEVATEALSDRWYFAEGEQGTFDTYVLIGNPSSSSVTATVTFLRDVGSAVLCTMTVPAMGRATLWAGDVAELDGHGFSIHIEATGPVVAERATR